MPAAASDRNDLPVRCSSCRRRIGWTSTDSALRNSIYCDQWCASEPHATPLEARNDEWRILVANGVTPVEVSRRYGVAHSLVYRTLAKAKAA